MQCTSPIVNFAPSEAHEKVDDQSIKQSINQSINQSVDQPVNQLPIRKSSISSSPFLKISQSISQFAPTVLPSKINYQSTIFPLSPQLTNSPLNRSINQSKCQSPSFSSFKLEPAANIPTLDQSISQTLTDHSSIDQSTNHTLEADTRMQRVHREKSIRSPMTKRLSRSINQSTNESTPFSPAGEPITVEFPIDDSVNQSIIQSRNQSFNKELDESLNHVSLVKTDTSPTNQSIIPYSNQSPDQLISPSKVDHLLKEVDGALFGSSSMANEVAQARKEDELSPVPFNQSINPSTSPPPGVQFNQSISRLLDDDNLLDCSDKHSSLSTLSLLTRRVSLDRSPGQPVDQSTNQSCEDISIVGKQVPVRFVVPPAAVESEKSKQHDVSEAVQSIKSLFSPSASSFTQSLDQPIIQPTNQIIDDSENQADTNSAKAISPPVTQPVNQPINIKLDSSFRIDKIPAGTVRTYHFAPSAPAVIEDTPLISPEQADQSADTPINSSTNQSTDQVIDKLTEHLLYIPASVTSSPSNQISIDHVGDQLSNQSLDDSINQQIDLAAIQLTPPTPASTPLSDEPAPSSDVTPSPPLSDVAHSLVTSGSALCPDTVDSSGEPAGNMQVDGSLSYAAGDRNSSADLQFQENHRPSLGQTDVASLQASVEERRTIPPSMSQKELLECLLPRLSPSVEMLSVDVPNEVCVISPQAMAARRLLLAEYAKSPILDVDIKPSADSTLKVDIHPIAKTSKRSRKSKNQRSTTSSPVPLSVPLSNLNASSRSTQSLTPETSKSEPQAKLVTTEQPSDLPEPSEELHEISPKNNDKLSQIDQSQETPDLKDHLSSENQSISHSKSEHEIDELSIKTENEIEPRLYSLPNLTSYHPTDEWSPDAEREKTEIPDTHKLYDDSSDITDTHDNALLGLEHVVVESKRYIPKKLASPPPQSSTQDEEAFWRMQAEEYAFEYPRTAVTFVHSICVQSTAMRLLFVLSLVLNIVAPLILFLHANEAQITIMCQILAFSCAYWVYAKYDFVTAVFASQALLLPSILFIYESFVKETSLLEFIAVLGTYMTSPRMWWDTSLLCYLWLWASLVLQVICLVGGSTIAFRGRA